MAAQLLGHDTRASEAAMRAERKLRLEQALNSMDPIDREVLALRHFELTPGAAIYLNTLDVALYRTGQYAEAIATWRKVSRPARANPTPSTCISWRWPATR